MSLRFSVVVALGGDPDEAKASLTALQRARHDGVALEVVVVGPGAERAPWVAAGVPIRRIESDAGGAAAAWNRGAAAVAGEILLFLRSGVVVEPDILAAFALVHAGADPVIGLGEVSPAAGSHPLSGQPAVAGPAEPALHECSGRVVSVPAGLFRRAEGFGAGLAWGHEVELAYRLRGLGARLRRLPAPVGRLVRRTTRGEAVANRMAAGEGSVALYRRTPGLLPHLELGGFHADRPPGLRLRRLLLDVGAPEMPPGLETLARCAISGERWLRFEHAYHYWRGVRRALGTGAEWDAILRPPVILMYHAVGHPRERPGRYIVPARRLHRQLRWLARRGYRVLGLEELLEHRRRHVLPPARTVVITFDDGYADNYQLGVPLLMEHGFRATFFVVSQYVGRRNSWDLAGELAGRELMTADDMRAIRRTGMEIGAHSRTHPVLPELPRAAAAGEIAGAKHDLEAVLREPVRTFAYPYGRLDDLTAGAVADAGFEAACCSRSGVNDPAVPDHLLRRVEVRGTDSMLRFMLSVRRGRAGRSRR